MKSTVRIFFCLAAALFAASTAFAQDFAIDSFSLDSGGGTSTGGGFEVSGSITQPEADAMSGGIFSLTGEFPGLVPAAPTTALPVTIFDNSAGTYTGGRGATTTTWLAGRFCLGTQPYLLDSLSLLLSNGAFDGQPRGESTVRLQVYDSDPVSGKPLASTGVTMTLSGLTNPMRVSYIQWTKWTNASPLLLSADTCYWAVFSIESGVSVGTSPSVTKPTGDAGSFGFTASENAGATWGTPDGSFNIRMLIQGIAVESANRPLLSIAGEGEDVRIFWPLSATGFVLDQSPTTTGAWSQVAFPYSTNEIDISVREASPPGNRFYRLRRP